MKKMPIHKYKKYPRVDLKDRTWPDNEIEKAPIWCSVDLRDGNQALIQPMKVEEKVEMFKYLVSVGFKEIEIGFPSASQTEFDFLRKLVSDNLIPDDVTIQVLTQSRDHLIKRTFEAVEGIKNSIIHLYNSTSTLQRDVVFRMTREQIIEIAVNGAKLVKEMAEKADGNIRLEYSPESFTGTELDYALEICEAVMDVWEPTKENKIILNLPATVEMSMANIYADQIEWFSRNIKNRETVLISLHTHNDRGTGVAASELGILAGADRVEGTLFGNGERTGNADIVNLALNLFSQGVDPELDFSDINKAIEIYEKSNKIDVHIRHPYAGKLVYTAFSGSHQDAINKGMKIYKDESREHWEVPYLPIDPADLGRDYEALVRINSQSGKGGIAYIMENEFAYRLPKAMHPVFAKTIQKMSEDTGKEVLAKDIYESFKENFIEINNGVKFISCSIKELENNITIAKAELEINGEKLSLEGQGNGPIDAFKNAIKAKFDIKLISYDEHSLGEGADSKAVSYIQIEMNGKKDFGVGTDTNISIASIKGIISGINRLI